MIRIVPIYSVSISHSGTFCQKRDEKHLKKAFTK
ncbi:hypothetical protein M5005_Spy1588 [Streptococcus pyogenes MGAS5005]|uniref:Uncharacterized protein n=1 Tax=Streptococcus pyogenes serotype M12 (strain MGAS9429) TaxID=370551 RepID=Q1JK43_STRPC|nr:hypothetical protein M5005_Spy1588 [Streptococcus pyogenes MGAS5005]ABF32780.1 hypothetical protein MGAS9429_Spy1593 [Streptococcus pyogenes MGAS9429]ABF34724.1 hypothetical protein MGAS10270_Spy1659 [Streptococcus pyogenes MGAS10270]ABF36665.1 hypothetical protein MGAS2096_Spy1613 [Streptococcus pyogenes MGAS2096]